VLGFLVLSGDDGADVVSSLSVVAAWAVTTHTVRVELTTEPKHSDQYEIGDALNVASWMVQNITTGETLTVIGATMFDATHVDVMTLEALPNHLVNCEITASANLQTALGELVGGTTSADFTGVVQTLDPVDSVTVDAFRDRDLANPPFQVDRGIGYSGTIIIGSDGDYETEAGGPLVRKCVMRRLGTPRGSFRHLPRYGVGLKEKEPLPSASDLIKLRADIEAQALEEPDVETATARLTLDRSGVLIVQLAFVTKGITINLRMGVLGGRLVEL